MPHMPVRAPPSGGETQTRGEDFDDQRRQPESTRSMQISHHHPIRALRSRAGRYCVLGSRAGGPRHVGSMGGDHACVIRHGGP